MDKELEIILSKCALSTRMTVSIEDLERFWVKVGIRGIEDCWPWLASISTNGYGQFNFEGTMVNSHRLAWRFINGPIPEDKLILHKCNNRPCCNPNHLYCGTQSNNMQDAWNSGSLTGVKRGLSGTKLTAEEIKIVRTLNIAKKNTCNSIHCQRELTSIEVSKMFDVSASTIRRIWNTDIVLCREGYYI